MKRVFLHCRPRKSDQIWAQSSMIWTFVKHLFVKGGDMEIYAALAELVNAAYADLGHLFTLGRKAEPRQAPGSASTVLL